MQRNNVNSRLFWICSKRLIIGNHKNNSEKARVLFLSLIEQRNDLLLFEEEPWSILEESHFKSWAASEVRDRVIGNVLDLLFSYFFKRI